MNHQSWLSTLLFSLAAGTYYTTSSKRTGVSVSFLCLVAVVAVAMGVSPAGAYYCELDDPLRGCNPDSLDPAESGCFDPELTRTVFGINQWATSDVPVWAVEYAASILAEFLDSDEDGIPDDPNVIEALLNNDDAKDVAVLKCRGAIGRGPLKDLFWSITRTYGQPTLDDGDDVGWNEWKRITMEETHHALHRGLAEAYPDVFSQEPDTDLSLAIDEAYADCEYPGECAPECKHYECDCQHRKCGEPWDYECTWIADSCDGVYHYSEPMHCDFQTEGGGCQGSEGFYWPSTTLLGWQEGDVVRDQISGEWEISTAKELATNRKTKLMYELVSGQAPSQKKHGYRVPSRLPDGHYGDDDYKRLACEKFFEKAGCKAVEGCDWRSVENGLSTCIKADGDYDIGFCPDPDGGCLTEKNLNECQKLIDNGCKDILELESCPVQFRCGDDTGDDRTKCTSTADCDVADEYCSTVDGTCLKWGECTVLEDCTDNNENIFSTLMCDGTMYCSENSNKPGRRCVWECGIPIPSCEFIDDKTLCQTNPECSWITKKQKKRKKKKTTKMCIRAPDQKACSKIKIGKKKKRKKFKKNKCKEMGCIWKKSSCMSRLKPEKIELDKNESDLSLVGDGIEKNDLSDTDTFKDFFDKLIGLDGKEAKVEILKLNKELINKLDFEYDIYICSNGFSNEDDSECYKKNLRYDRLKITVDGNNVVKAIIIS